MQAKYPHLASVMTAILDTGLTKTDIARIAERDPSQVGRWADGKSAPAYPAAMRLAAHLRHSHPELADGLLSASGYGTPDDTPPPSVIPPTLMAVVRRTIEPELQAAAIAALEEVLRGGSSPEGAEEAPSVSPRRAG